MSKLFSTLLLLAFTAEMGCSQELVWPEVLSDIRSRYPQVHQLSTDSLAAWLATDDAVKPLLIDSREKEEFDVSHLPGAMQMDPDTEDFSALAGVSKDAPIVVYCSVGYRSSKIAELLKEEGFTNVNNLEGSIFAWANEGRPVVHDGAPVSAVHPYNKVWGMLLKKELRSF